MAMYSKCNDTDWFLVGITTLIQIFKSSVWPYCFTLACKLNVNETLTFENPDTHSTFPPEENLHSKNQ